MDLALYVPDTSACVQHIWYSIFIRIMCSAQQISRAHAVFCISFYTCVSSYSLDFSTRSFFV